MGLVLLIVIGVAAGFLATRIMGLNTDVLTTVAIGVTGALMGGFALRAIVTIGGWMAGFIGAVFGAIILIWLWKTYIR